MSGGAWEYVAGYVNNGNGNLTSYGSSLVNGDAKTKNVYTKASTDNNTNNYNQNASKYGDAVYETSANGNTSNGSWYGDYSYFPYTSYPFFTRGGLLRRWLDCWRVRFQRRQWPLQQRFFVPSGLGRTLMWPCTLPFVNRQKQYNTSQCRLRVVIWNWKLLTKKVLLCKTFFDIIQEG